MNHQPLVSNLTQFIQLRAVVAALGELSHNRWWESQFLSHTGLRFLQRLYPRTALVAAIRAATRVACKKHDTTIGQGEVYHLYRLTPAFEHQLEIILQQEMTDLNALLYPLLDNQMALTSHLDSLTAGLKAQAVKGPYQITVVGPDLVNRLAATYQAAFSHNTVVFPYFTAESLGILPL